MANGQGKKLFLVAGQSNAVGVGSSDSSVIYAGSLCFEFRTTANQLLQLKDPVGYNAPNEDFQAAVTGSAWPAFAHTYSQLTADTVIIVQAAKGATACNQVADAGAGNWSSSYHLFEQAVAKAKAAEAFTGIQLNGIIWLQGETDAVAIQSGKISQCQYKSALQDLIQRFRQQLRCNLPFYIIQTGLYTTPYDPGFNAARNMQRQVANEDPLTFIADSTTYTFRKTGLMRSDSIHYCQTALNNVGETVAANISYIEQHNNFDSCYTVQPAPAQPDWKVYPSPFSDQLNIEVRNFTCADMDIQICDIWGRTCYKASLSCVDSPPLLAHVNTAGLSRGAYIIHLVLNKQWALKQKIVKD